MARTIFVNLPVADVARSVAFYQAIGCVLDARFSGPHAASLKWTDTIVIGVLDRAFYATLSPKPIADTEATSAALFALGLDSRAEVDAITEAAIAAGAREGHPAEDEGFMYSRAFYDPDGHAFGPVYVEAAATPAGAG